MPSNKLRYSLRYLTDVRIRVGEAEGLEIARQMARLTNDEMAVMDRAIDAGISAVVCADQIIARRRLAMADATVAA